MANKEKWLEGELKYAEGKATAGSLLRAMASELVEQGWVDYPRNDATEYWGFNGLRQITLHSETKQSNIKLYEAVTNTLPNGDEIFSKGDLINEDSYKVIGRVIEGVDGTDLDKTKQGQFVFIEMVHSDVRFQQTTFLKQVGVNGKESIQASLKSIPKGDVTLYEDTLIKVEEEVLLNKNGNGLVFNIARTPISQSKDVAKKLEVKVGGVAAEDTDYVVDYFNGNIIFKEYVESEVTASYSVVTGERGDKVSEDKYSIMGDTLYATDEGLDNIDIMVDVDYYWGLHYPLSVNQIDNRAIFKTKVDVSPDKSKNAFKTFYWELGKFDVDLPTTKVTKEVMGTYNNIDFNTKYKNLKLLDDDGEKNYTVYVDGSPVEDGFTIDKHGEVSFDDVKGGEVLELAESMESIDFQEYQLANGNIIEGTLRIRANKDDEDTAYDVPLSTANINYQTGEILFNEPVTGGGDKQSSNLTTDYTYQILTNNKLFKVDEVIANGKVVSAANYSVDLIGKTVTLTKTSDYDEEPASVQVTFQTETTLHAEYKWSQLVEITYEYYPDEDSPLFDDLMKDNPDLADYVTGFRSRFSSKLESETPSEDMNSAYYRLDPNHVSAWSKWSWYRKSAVLKEEVKLGTWTPVKFYMNFTKEYVNVVLQGEHSVDVHPYKNYIISHAYVGALENYECSIDDAMSNFGMTVGSDELYCKVFHDEVEKKENLPELWGYKTGTGVTDIIMEKTLSNLPFQAHYPAFYTNPEFMDKHFISVSEATKKHHFSPITIVHGTERERGKMQSIVIGDRSAIFHLDELIEHRDEFNSEDALTDCNGKFLNECNSPIKSKEKKYIQFNINAPYWFANNSPNTLYGIAIRKS